MSSRDFLTTQTQRQSIERSKLQTTVARDTRNRRLTSEITRNKRLHHVALEIALEIQHVKRKSEVLGNATRVVNVVERAAARRQRIAVFVCVYAPPLIPQLHRKADEMMPLLFQNCCGCGRIHAATHCYRDLHNCPIWYLYARMLRCRSSLCNL